MGKVVGKVIPVILSLAVMFALFPFTAAAQTPPRDGYVIITSSSIYDPVNPLPSIVEFLNHKTTQGFAAGIMTEADWDVGTGTTKAHRLYDWLAANRTALNLKYVLLIGDPDPVSGNVPMSLMRGAPSDLSYADCIPGGIYELLVGRIPYLGEDVNVLNAILRDTIAYNTANPASTGWRRRSLVAVHPLNDPHNTDDSYQRGERLVNEVFYPNNFASHRIYELDYGLVPPPETTPCSFTTMPGEWASRPYGAVFFLTHGCGIHAIDVIDRAGAATLNPAYRSFVFEGACENGNPVDPVDHQTIAYAILKRGAVTTVAASITFVFNVEFPLDYFQKVIAEGKSAGEAFFETQVLHPESAYSLYGDPSARLNVPPADMILDPLARTHDHGADSGSVTVTAGAGVAWNVTSGAGWITVTSGAGGTGNGIVTYTVAPNLTGSDRTNVIAIGERYFYVSQACFAEAEDAQNVLPLLTDSKAAWGDVDNDGDLDLAIAGRAASGPVTRLFRNDGVSGGRLRFAPLATALTDVLAPVLEWGDFDNDGRLDLVIGGTAADNTVHVTVYRNGGSAGPNAWTFTPVKDMIRNKVSAVAWVDFDNDGDLDFLLNAAESFLNCYVEVCLNDGPAAGTGWKWKPINTGFPGDRCLVADLDGDDDLDLVVSSDEWSADVLRNDGPGIGEFWRLMPMTTLPSPFGGVNVSAVDFDNDGDTDLLSEDDLYRNDGNWTFTVISTSVQFGIGFGAWGDYDNDGDADLYHNGKIYRNDGPGGVDLWNFTDMHFMLPIMTGANAQWCDLNNDGRLDLSMTGAVLAGNSVRLLLSTLPVAANLTPTPPYNLAVSLSGRQALFTWSPGADGVQTPPPGLRYALYVGAAPGSPSTMSPLADTAGGYRRVTRAGNAGQQCSWQLSDLPPGTYYWGVQAIDTGLAGSPFTAGGSFFISPGLPGRRIFTSVTEINAALHLRKTIDIDNDGDLDLVLTTEGSAGTVVYRNDGPGAGGTIVFTPLATVIPGVGEAGMDWGDFDNDGDLDAVVNIIDQVTRLPATAVYRNDGNGTVSTWNFTRITAALSGLAYGQSSWGDLDNDGDLDLLLTGEDSFNTRLTKVYRNDGSAGGNAWMFMELGTPLVNLNSSRQSWFDFDNDGRLDLFLAGSNPSYDLVIKLYRNAGPVGTAAWNFEEIDMGLPAGSSCDGFAIGDYDQDGDIDLLLSGAFPSPLECVVYRNEGTGGGTAWNFTRIDHGFSHRYDPQLEWVDFDNDGDLDVSRGARDGRLPGTEIIRNDGGTHVSLGVINDRLVSVWGDFDNDGDADAVMARRMTAAVTPVAISLYRNDWLVPNGPPASPGGLTALPAPNGHDVTFVWSAATDDRTLDAGLSYNLYVGTTPGGPQERSPHADTASGYRRIAKAGDQPGSLLNWTIKDLPGGRYWWSVQAIDSARLGGPFAAEQTFTVNPTISGRVTDAGGNGLAGVSIRGLPGGTVLTDTNGYYAAAVPYDWTGTVTPYLAGGTYFTPGQRQYVRLMTDAKDQNYAVSGTAKLRVQYMTYRTDAVTDTIFVNARVYNDGNNDVSLKDVSFKYWYSSEHDSQAEKVEIDTAFKMPSGAGLMNYTRARIDTLNPEVNLQDRVQTTWFVSGAGVIKKNEYVEVHVRLHYTDWTKKYTQTGDYSFQNKTVFENTLLIPAYFKGSLVWGNPPF